jgi:hypothetical protein
MNAERADLKQEKLLKMGLGLICVLCENCVQYELRRFAFDLLVYAITKSNKNAVWDADERRKGGFKAGEVVKNGSWFNLRALRKSASNMN